MNGESVSDLHSTILDLNTKLSQKAINRLLYLHSTILDLNTMTEIKLSLRMKEFTFHYFRFEHLHFFPNSLPLMRIYIPLF